MDTLSIRPVKEALEDIDACIYPIQEGGVLNALWNYADGIGVGLDIDMRKIPIRQESVEISEFLWYKSLSTDGRWCLSYIFNAARKGVCSTCKGRSGLFCGLVR